MKKNNDLQAWFENELDNLKDDPGFIMEGLILDFTDRISEEMEKHSITRSQLARMCGKKPTQITRMLKGYGNLTLRTIAEVGAALGIEFKLDSKPMDNFYFKNRDFESFLIESEKRECQG